MAERLSREDFPAKVLESDRLSLVDFYSDSCIPCKKMSPVLAELEETFGERLFVGKVNIAWEKELTEQYQVMSAPTFLFFRDGAVVKKVMGAVKKAELEAVIKENL